MKISRQEVKEVLNLEAFERYKYFIKKVADFELMYGLKDELGDWALAEADENILFSLWSSKEFVEISAIEQWKDYLPVEISLNEFEDEILPFLEKTNYLLNIFPARNRTGFVVNLTEFVRDLNIELEKYE